MRDDIRTYETVAWQPELLSADLCALHGHGDCGGHEVDPDANIIACTCWCHSAEIAHA